MFSLSSDLPDLVTVAWDLVFRFSYYLDLVSFTWDTEAISSFTVVNISQPFPKNNNSICFKEL